MMKEVYRGVFFTIDGALVSQGEHHNYKQNYKFKPLKSLLKIEMDKNSFPIEEYSNLRRPGPKYPIVS